MSNVVIVGSNPSLITGTMGANGTLSEEFDLSMYTQFALTGDNLTNGTLNFLVSNQPLSAGDNYRTLRDSSGAAVAYGPLTGNVALREVDMRVLAPYRYVRILASIAQANSPTFTFVVKG